MRIRCLRSELEGISYDLEPGEVYEVISVEAGDLRILDDMGRPYLFPPELFEVVDPTRPAHWVGEVVDGAEYASAPELAVPGFFEDYFEGKVEALRTFHRYVNRHLRLTDAA